MTALKGFAINMINPFVILFWIGVVSVETARYQFSQTDIAVLFCCTLLTVFGTDLLKSVAAERITTFLNPKILLWVNRVAGVILILSGIIMIVKVVNTFF
jgi:threonine/homoserine/homoserine lactone efflux protein